MTRPATVLMTADAVGGVWRYAIDLAAALGPRDVRTILAVLGPVPDAAQRREAAAAGVRLVETSLPLDWMSDGPAPVIAAGAAIADLAAAEEVDLVQLNMPTLGARARFPAPVVAVAHGCVATWWSAAHGTALPPAFRWQRRLTQEAFAAVDAVVAPSASHAGDVARCYGLAQPPLAIHNGRFPLGPSGAGAGQGTARARGVFTAGRLWDQIKDTPLLDRVAARLPVPFRAAGATRGPHRETVVTRHLDTLGQLGAAAIARELARRPIFVSAARFEPFGLAVLEAASAGCPLVLSDIATFRELWTGAALFVPAGDEDGYVVTIARVLADPDLARHLGEAAQLRAARYTPHATATAMASIYAGLVATPAGARRAAA